MASKVDVLIRTKELLEIPGAWIKGRLFDNGSEWDTDSLRYNAPGATQYCVYGALHKAKVELGYPLTYHGEGDKHLEQAVKDIVPSFNNQVNNLCAASYNNQQHSVEPIKALVCKAIELAMENEEQAHENQ